MEASAMISAWHLCHNVIVDMMGHSLRHQSDLTVKIFPLSSNFLSTKNGGLVDLCDILIWKRELWAYESTLLSLLHHYSLGECTNTAVYYKTRLKR